MGSYGNCRLNTYLCSVCHMLSMRSVMVSDCIMSYDIVYVV